MDRGWNGKDSGTGDAFRYPHPEPEILPPGAQPVQSQPYYREPVPVPPPPRRRRAQWAIAPATYVLLGINILVFLGMVLSGVSLTSPTSRQLLDWGANYGPSVLLSGEWWRLITAMFVHVGVIHLATNMWCLWNLGLLGEPLIGPLGMFAAYLLTGVAGNLLSTAVHAGVPGAADGPGGIVGAGASGAVFGLAGVLIVLLKSPLLPIPQIELKKLRRSVIYFALLNFVIGAGTWVARTSIQIDNMAHLGGFLGGLALGLPMIPRLGAQRTLFERRRLLAITGMAFLLLLLSFGLHSFWR